MKRCSMLIALAAVLLRAGSRPVQSRIVRRTRDALTKSYQNRNSAARYTSDAIRSKFVQQLGAAIRVLERESQRVR